MRIWIYILFGLADHLLFSSTYSHFHFFGQTNMFVFVFKICFHLHCPAAEAVKICYAHNIFCACISIVVAIARSIFYALLGSEINIVYEIYGQVCQPRPLLIYAKPKTPSAAAIITKTQKHVHIYTEKKSKHNIFTLSLSHVVCDFSILV